MARFSAVSDMNREVKTRYVAVRHADFSVDAYVDLPVFRTAGRAESSRQ